MEFFRGGLLPVLIGISAAAAWSQDLSLEEAVSQGKFSQAAEIFGRMDNNEHAKAKNLYYGGYAYMRMNRFDEARQALHQLDALGWKVYSQWSDTFALLHRLEIIRSRTPTDWQSTVPGIFVHAETPDAWMKPVLDAVPEFSRIGRAAFGDSLPRIDFYLFSDRQYYLDFFEAVFNKTLPVSWEDGTGVTHIVLFCETQSRPAGEPETVADVLHEFGHAWAATYLRLKYDRDCLVAPLRCPYIDEGIAEFLAAMWDKGRLSRIKNSLAQYQAARGMGAPSFEDLKTYDGFYNQGDVGLHYELSALLIERLLNPEGAKKIRTYLDVLAETGDPTRALATASGKDPAEAYQSLVKELWAIPPKDRLSFGIPKS